MLRPFPCPTTAAAIWRLCKSTAQRSGISLAGLNPISTNEFLKCLIALFFFFFFSSTFTMTCVFQEQSLHFVFHHLKVSCISSCSVLKVFMVSFPLSLFTRCTNPLLSECMVQMKANSRCDVYVTHCWYDGAKTICESNCWMIFIIINFFSFLFTEFFS